MISSDPVLAEPALSEAALTAEPAEVADSEVATSNDFLVLRNSTPSSSATSASETADALLGLIQPGSMEDWLDSGPMIGKYTIAVVTDAVSFEALLAGFWRAVTASFTAENAEKFASAVKMAADIWLGLLLGPVYWVVAGDPKYKDRLYKLIEGLYDGLAKSGLFGAENLVKVLEAEVLLGIAAPVNALLFIAGTLYQMVSDIAGVFQMVYKVIGEFEALKRLVANLPKIFSAFWTSIMEDESGETMRQLGEYLGTIAGTDIKKHLVPDIDLANIDPKKLLYELAEFGFNVGTYVGPLIVDLILTLLGVGYVEVAMKFLGRAAVYSTEAVEWLVELLKRILKAVDSKVLDDLLEVAGEIVKLVTARVDAFIADWVATGKYVESELREAFDTLLDALGTDDFQWLAGCAFCTLKK